MRDPLCAGRASFPPPAFPSAAFKPCRSADVDEADGVRQGGDPCGAVPAHPEGDVAGVGFGDQFLLKRQMYGRPALSYSDTASSSSWHDRGSYEVSQSH